MEAKKGYTAKAKNLPMAPFKVRPIADNIRRRPYVEAVAILEALPNKGAKFLKKVIESAAANALNQNNMLDEETLYISELMIDGGPTSKRIWPRSRGRADRLIRRTCHIYVALDEIGSKGVS
ncbi:MAG: 50S ribosomal protein L22 [Spirochaetaceae bacterium]|jgi:large subunit ribosomal protein L22|nr:50S ribosomal protein L22 [Spirochaetaceae bacterium]